MTSTTAEPRFGGGWRIVARKELADHLHSVRTAALVVILALVAGGAVYSAAGGLRSAASDVSGTTGLFLRIFTSRANPIPFSLATFIGFFGPLIGIALGFDAINGERAQRTLPRLASQPIYRDDVINGKVVAGSVVIAVTMVAVIALVSALGILRLGILPALSDLERLLVWVLLAIVYVAFWLAFAALCSVLMPRAATSAMVAVAVWLTLTLFGTLLAHLLAGVIAPIPPGAPVDAVLHNAHVGDALARLSPATLYDEATTALLDPGVRALGLVTLAQIDRALATPLSFTESLLLVWPQMVGLVAASALSFAAGYIAFMRQEIRA